MDLAHREWMKREQRRRALVDSLTGARLPSARPPGRVTIAELRDSACSVAGPRLANVGRMRFRGLALAVFFAGCLGSYKPAPDGQGVTPTTPTPATPSNGGDYTPDTPSPPVHPTTPPASPDLGAPPPVTPPPASPDLGTPPPQTSQSCNQLSLCCDQLQPPDSDNCTAAVAQAKDGVCSAILAALAANGVPCP
jgi:hypothetical protein